MCESVHVSQHTEETDSKSDITWGEAKNAWT